MKAIRQHAFGGPEELRLEELPDPRPARGQVLVRVESAGVHFIDTLVRRGVTAGASPLPELPVTPGREVAGVVDQTGRGVDRSLAGRRVVASLEGGGGYAEFAAVDAGAFHLLPEGLDADSAVAMVATGRTALAILEAAAPDADDVVLVTAAAGGIGTLLVQALHDAGATVVGVAGGKEKVALVQQLGASAAVDYSQPGWPDTVRAALGDQDVTLVLDGVGGDTGRAALELLAPRGRLVLFGMSSGSLTPLSAGDLFAHGITALSAIGARLAQRPGGLRPLETAALQTAVDGRLTPVIGQRFPLAEAAAAHQAVESRTTTGKTVLNP